MECSLSIKRQGRKCKGNVFWFAPETGQDNCRRPGKCNIKGNTPGARVMLKEKLVRDVVQTNRLDYGVV
jgi:hypothetical protein